MLGRSLAHSFAALVREHAETKAPNSEAPLWFRRSLGLQPKQIAKWMGAFSGTQRRMGEALVQVPSELDACTVYSPEDGWALDELTRVTLLLTFVRQLSESEQPELLEDLYLRGGMREQRAVLRSLPYLQTPQAYSQLATEACRTNVVDVFAALANDNPYPAQMFENEAFHQLVLKSLFLGVSLQRIIHLERRVDTVLLQKVAGYESERKAAGRAIPSDVDYLRSL